MAKGFINLSGQKGRKMQYLQEKTYDLAKKKGFDPLFLPTVGEKKLFIEKIGDGTDIVNREIFSLGNLDTHLMLRPEFTALVCKYAEKTQNPMRLYSFGQNFRRERPQKGRLREFYQINLEIIKEKVSNAIYDLLYIPLKLFQENNIKYSFHCNYLAGPEYYTQLKNYFKENYQLLSSLSQERFNKGAILRILDSKEKEDEKIINNAPKMPISPENQILLESIMNFVRSMGGRAKINPKLVRGLDYYRGLVFEFIDINREGLSQNALGGGGEYTVKQGTENNVTAIGLALGANRLLDYIPPIIYEKTALLVPLSKIQQYIEKNPGNYLFLAPETNKKTIKLAKQYSCQVFIGAYENGKLFKKNFLTQEKTYL